MKERANAKPWCKRKRYMPGWQLFIFRFPLPHRARVVARVPGYDPFGPEGANANLLVSNEVIDPISGSVPHRSQRCRVRKEGVPAKTVKKSELPGLALPSSLY